MRIRQIMFNAGFGQLLDEIIRGLLQREHFHALIAYQIDDGLGVGLPLVDIEGHHAGIGVGGVRFGRGYGVLCVLGK